MFVFARLAQLVEQLVYTEKVGGSNPSPRTAPDGTSDRDLKAGVRRHEAGSRAFPAGKDL